MERQEKLGLREEIEIVKKTESLILPEIGGRDLASRLSAKHPGMKALFVSDYDDDSVRRHRINPRLQFFGSRAVTRDWLKK